MKKILILAYNPNHIDFNLLDPICTDVGKRYNCRVYTIPHHDREAKPIYLVFNNFGVEHANKEKHQETKGNTDIQVPILRRRITGKTMDRR